MKHLYILPLLTVAALCLGIVACTATDEFQESVGDASSLHFRIIPMETVGNGGDDTRLIDSSIEDNTGDNTDNYVKNLWLFQFAGSSDAAVLKKVTSVSMANIEWGNEGGYAALKSGATLLDDDATVGNTNQVLLLIANVPITVTAPVTDWNLMLDTSTLRDVLNKSQSITSEADLHSTIDGVETLVMSGLITSTTGRAGLLSAKNVVSLQRNIAKFTLNLKLATGLTLNSLQMWSVSGALSWGAAADIASAAEPIVYPATVTPINYSVDDITDITGDDGIHSFTWYVSANMRGVNTASTTSKTKPDYAPFGATYLRLKLAGTEQYIVLYLGANTVDDFNLRPNTHYILNFYLGPNALLSVGDARLRVPPAPAANSYMLHPSTTKRVSINIPLSRINEYWDGGSNGHGTAANKLAVGDTWTASILWSDITAINQAAIDIYVPKHTGSYVEDDYFTVALPSTYSGGTGNFVVQVKNTNNVVLWSWHIWVTDYNPDSAGEALTVNGYKSRTGGQVEMYDGATVMMDRNLGQIEQYPAYPSGDGSTSRGILHYQSGRKDPFPTYTSAPLSSNTVDITTYDGTSPQSIATSVQHPLTFIKGSNSSYNWCSENGDTGYLWNDPTVTSYTTSASKSLYDPCPPGWRVPAIGVWNNLGDGSSSGVSLGNSNSAWNDPKSPGLNYPKTTPYSFYAAAGFRDYSSGGLGYVGTSGYFWSASPYSSTYGEQNLGFYSTYVSPQNYSYRAYGFPVRCSQAK